MSDTATHGNNDPARADLTAVQNALRGLQFGTVTIIVQDGLIVQIDRTEKRRLQRRTPPASSAGQDRG